MLTPRPGPTLGAFARDAIAAHVVRESKGKLLPIAARDRNKGAP